MTRRAHDPGGFGGRPTCGGRSNATGGSMTTNYPEGRICVDCGGPVDEARGSSSFWGAADEPMLVVHATGYTCGQWIHGACAADLNAYGSRQDNCPCGSGP